MKKQEAGKGKSTYGQIRSDKLKAKAYRRTDTDGLFVYVMPSGRKIRRLRYKFQKRTKTLTLDNYPSVTLPDARREQEMAKHFLRKGCDPVPFSVPTGRTAPTTMMKQVWAGYQHDRYSNAAPTRHHSSPNINKSTTYIPTPK
ncbi:Arm DNA-binding domain-containing protein [Komagataeibacter oboediens]|uniref:DUF4102 domain-containing protein n=1 Tax=Komagataeibacter oboediens TaxID=65958 RepID=A0ABS5SL32_9PROT|nr:Arm DNA-binding domain-containing protein [Komagataeibacter oboediens]MBL7233755.1 DUF4102 domain-containing protein [Komagataeibacter oboediens]MBT0674901.1 DUF4102 domain-containing protein [Komagataeibacter oboediens]MBT0678551.1 DUF4102 domain-containing protein [Komagataeibacter oboediens]